MSLFSWEGPPEGIRKFLRRKSRGLGAYGILLPLMVMTQPEHWRGQLSSPKIKTLKIILNPNNKGNHPIIITHMSLFLLFLKFTLLFTKKIFQLQKDQQELCGVFFYHCHRPPPILFTLMLNGFQCTLS